MLKILLLALSIIAGFYTEPAQVVATENQSAILEDSRGHLWEVFGNFDEGADYLVTFSDSGTPEIEDDIIISISRK